MGIPGAGYGGYFVMERLLITGSDKRNEFKCPANKAANTPKEFLIYCPCSSR